MDDADSRGPDVLVPPPLIFVIGFFVAWLGGRRIAGAPLVIGRFAETVALVGALIAAVGIAMVAWGMITFARAKTAIVPVRPASRLVQHGPYRFTRNPMYTGLTLAYVGAAALVNSVWPLIVLPLVLFALYRLVIAREEAYLRQAFGPVYDEYRRRVRRWL